MNKPFRLLALTAAVLTAFSFTLARAAVEIGQPAPAFTLTDLDGQAHSLADFKGKIVVLEWHNPDCPFVKKHYEKSGHLPKLQKAATADDVIWLLINSGAPGKQGADYSASEVKAYLNKNHSTATAYLTDKDGNVGHLYGAKTTPHLFVINDSGLLVYNGAIDSIRSADSADIAKATDYVTAALTAVKAGKPVEKSATEPYGCSVKY